MKRVGCVALHTGPSSGISGAACGARLRGHSICYLYKRDGFRWRARHKFLETKFNFAVSYRARDVMT